MEISAELRAAMLRGADQAARRAYAPYSKFRVGATVLAGGAVFSGCNVENASSNLGLCAERAAIVAAIAAGHRNITAVAISFPDLSPAAGISQRMPCGACRQVLAEFGKPDLLVMTEGAEDSTLDELLPRAFRL